ncbi:hypothetical protein Q3G72_005066 [Acer saccharum]|nr:hypothetical protein Q3G72_005066 [Acer saccharum]
MQTKIEIKKTLKKNCTSPNLLVSTPPWNHCQGRIKPSGGRIKPSGGRISVGVKSNRVGPIVCLHRRRLARRGQVGLGWVGSGSGLARPAVCNVAVSCWSSPELGGCRIWSLPTESSRSSSPSSSCSSRSGKGRVEVGSCSSLRLQRRRQLLVVAGTVSLPDLVSLLTKKTKNTINSTPTQPSLTLSPSPSSSSSQHPLNHHLHHHHHQSSSSKLKTQIFSQSAADRVLLLLLLFLLPTVAPSFVTGGCSSWSGEKEDRVIRQPIVFFFFFFFCRWSLRLWSLVVAHLRQARKKIAPISYHRRRSVIDAMAKRRERMCNKMARFSEEDDLSRFSEEEGGWL